MNYTRIGGLIALLVGIGLIIYGFHGKSRMEKARGQIDTADRFIPKNPLTDVAKKEMYRRVDEYELPVMLCFIGGGILIIGGAAMLYFARDRKN